MEGVASSSMSLIIGLLQRDGLYINYLVFKILFIKKVFIFSSFNEFTSC